ncbi:MAG: nitronate monooxygenase [Pseudomonadota bacterium]
MWAKAKTPEAFRAVLRERLRLPVVAAPMFLVSGPDLVTAATAGGVIGAFPTLNARTEEDLERWLTVMSAAPGGDLIAANLILHRSNTRRDHDLAAVVRHKVPLVIASVGPPDPVIEPVQGYGGKVFADVASLRHARRAVKAGADGLVLLTAGAGGNAGWLNPFAFVAEVRRFFHGPIALAGCVTQGHELRALEALDVDLGYLGTPFIAAEESLAPAVHKQALVDCDADGILLTDAVTGLPANFVQARLEEAGVVDAAGKPLADGRTDVKAWKEVWSAGQGVGSVKAVQPAAAILAALEEGYQKAIAPGG